MYTYCPNCHNYFSITQEHLDVANGQVRCGNCNQIFNALESLYDELPAETTPETELPEAATAESADKLTQLQQALSSSARTTEDQQPNDSVGQDGLSATPLAEPSSVTAETTPDSSTSGSTKTGIDIKEKMERIAASLSAATMDLKNARESSKSFQDTEFPLSPEEQAKGSLSKKRQADNAILEKKFTDGSLPEKQLADGSLIEENHAEVSLPEKDLAEGSLPEKDLAEGSLPENEMDDLDIILPGMDAAETEEADSAGKIESINDELDIHSEIELSNDQDAAEPGHVEEIENTTAVSIASPLTGFKKSQVDQDDIEILNSLIEESPAAQTSADVTDNPLFDELDELNKTLASEGTTSLDDEFADPKRIPDEKNDDELLAELEELGDNLSQESSFGYRAESDEEVLQKAFEKEPEPIAESLPDANLIPAPTQSINEDEVVPSFLTQKNKTASKPVVMFAWMAGTLVLLSLLFIQYLHFNSVQFAQDPTYRPWLEKICPLSGCSLPLLKKPRSIVTVQHDVHSHPDIKNALQIQLTYKNNASLTQAYPILEIIFSNHMGEVIARRQFSADEYLADTITDKSKLTGLLNSGIKPKQKVEVNLEIVDPDPRALLSFQFNYL